MPSPALISAPCWLRVHTVIDTLVHSVSETLVPLAQLPLLSQLLPLLLLTATATASKATNRHH
jgi:hypothetical protein